MQIKEVTIEDLPSFMEAYDLMREEFEYPDTPSMVIEEFLTNVIDSDYKGILAAFHSGQVVGFSFFHIAMSTYLLGTSLNVLDVYVRQNWRNKGLGTMLMKELHSLCDERGVGSLFLLTLTTNKGAQRFYERLGYEKKPLFFYRKPLSS